MEDALPLSDKQHATPLASDQGTSAVAFSTDHPDKVSVESSLNDAKTTALKSRTDSLRRKSVTSLQGIMLTPYKLGLVASIIFIIVLFLMPIIFYYSLNDSPPDSSPRFVNISQVKWCLSTMCIYSYIKSTKVLNTYHYCHSYVCHNE